MMHDFGPGSSIPGLAVIFALNGSLFFYFSRKNVNSCRITIRYNIPKKIN